MSRSGLRSSRPVRLSDAATVDRSASIEVEHVPDERSSTGRGACPRRDAGDADADARCVGVGLMRRSLLFVCAAFAAAGCGGGDRMGREPLVATDAERPDLPQSGFGKVEPPEFVEHVRTGIVLRLVPRGWYWQPVREYRQVEGEKYSTLRETPERRRVRLPLTYYIGTTEVTEAHFSRLMQPTEPVANPRMPHCFVDKEELDRFVGLTADLRLPSEAEWEFAALADPAILVHYDDTVTAWRANGANAVQPVATLRPNYLGLFDMMGNVQEAVADGYEGTVYDGIEAANQRLREDADDPIVRSGASALIKGDYVGRAAMGDPRYQMGYSKAKDGWRGALIGARLATSTIYVISRPQAFRVVR